MNALQWDPVECSGWVELGDDARLELAVWQDDEGRVCLGVALRFGAALLWAELRQAAEC